MELQMVRGIKTVYIFQTGLTGSTGYVLSLNPVMVSRINKPQMNADERRLIASVHLIGQEKRKAEQQKFYTYNPIRAYPRHPRNPRSIVYNAGEKFRYKWYFSSITEQEVAQ